MFHEDLLILRNLAGKDKRVVHSFGTVEELQRAVCVVIWLRLEIHVAEKCQKSFFQNDLINETHALEGVFAREIIRLGKLVW